MLFKPNDYKFSVLSENMHYLFLFKSPRNSSKVIHLAKQVSPYDNKFIVRSYKEATQHQFTYLLFDFHQKTPEKIRLRSKIFPSEGTMTVHINQNSKGNILYYLNKTKSLTDIKNQYGFFNWSW